MLVIVDEADKPDVGQKVIESARSSVTDGNDCFLVIGNPPRSEANSMYDLLVDENYHTEGVIEQLTGCCLQLK